MSRDAPLTRWMRYCTQATAVSSYFGYALRNVVFPRAGVSEGS